MNRWKTPCSVALTALLIIGGSTLLVLGSTHRSASTDQGPRAGRLVQVWKHSEIDFSGLRYDRQSDSLLATTTDDQSPGRVIVLNPSDGALRWQDWPSFYRAGTVTGQGGIVVAALSRTGQNLLAASGTESSGQLWTSVLPTGREIVSIAGAYPVLSEGQEVTGIARRTGWPKWHFRIPSGCELRVPPDGDQYDDPDVVPLLLECAGGQTRIIALDDATGRVRWQRTLPGEPLGESVVDVTSHDGLVGSSADGGLSLYDGRTGADVAEVPPNCLCDYVASKTTAVTIRSDPGGGPAVLEGIDLRSRKRLWRRSLPAAPQYTSVSGERMYAAVQLSRPLLPMALVTVDLRKGTVGLTALPVTAQGVTATAAGHGLLYLALRQGEKSAIIAYRTEDAPPFSGGASPRGWPDACSILPTGELSAALGPAYSVQPRRYGAAAPRLVHTVGCDYLLPGADPVVVSIEVGWVGATATEAKRLFADLRRQAYTAVGDVPGTGDEAFTEKLSGGYGSPDRQTLHMRVGCTLLSVGSTGPPEILPELARKVASHVHRCAA